MSPAVEKTLTLQHSRVIFFIQSQLAEVLQVLQSVLVGLLLRSFNISVWYKILLSHLGKLICTVLPCGCCTVPLCLCLLFYSTNITMYNHLFFWNLLLNSKISITIVMLIIFPTTSFFLVFEMSVWAILFSLSAMSVRI